MTVLIEDTARNTLGAWAEEAVQDAHASGIVISPFTTARDGTSYKPAALRVAERLRDVGGTVWFDPMTHALQMPAVGDFRYYDDWELWGGPRGDLSSEASRREHVRRVFEAQDHLGASHLAPTLLLHAPQSETSMTALNLARVALELDPACALSIAGAPPFWASGSSLDAHVGSFAQLSPSGWFLTVVRPIVSLPVQVQAEEVHGVCRTCRSLSSYGPVHLSHGDLAALPQLAAGASTVGTGWDPRQRLCAYPSYEEREAASGGGGWFQRPTIPGLLAVLSRAEAERLLARDATLAARLAPDGLPPDAPKEAFQHHAATLADLAVALTSGTFRERFDALDVLYESARADWPAARRASGCATDGSDWIDEFQDGLRLYGRDEGFC